MKFTICGSARFENLFHEWNKKLGLMGHISYGLMTYPSIEGDKTWYTPTQKETLDLCHLAKIEDSDAVLILNKEGYIGESTQRELKWALIQEKLIYSLEPIEGVRSHDPAELELRNLPKKELFG